MGGQVAETQLLRQNGDHRLQCTVHSGRLGGVHTKDSTGPGCVGASARPRAQTCNSPGWDGCCGSQHPVGKHGVTRRVSERTRRIWALVGDDGEG